MTEEEIARCFRIPSYHEHPELWVMEGDKTYICDSKHAALFYCQGWNCKLSDSYTPNGMNHPAALRAWKMGWDDADEAIGPLPLPSVL